MRLIVEPRKIQNPKPFNTSNTEYSLHFIDPFSGNVVRVQKSDNIGIFEEVLGKGVGKMIGK